MNKDKLKFSEKDKLRRKLIWKYFWKRKREEVWNFVKEYWSAILSFGWMVAIIFSIWYTIFINDKSQILNIVFLTPVIGIFIVLVVYLIFCGIRSFIEWIQSNWRWATQDADTELLRRRKGK